MKREWGEAGAIRLSIRNAKILRDLTSEFWNAIRELYARTGACQAFTSTMPAPTNTLIVEGSFEELADELATYLDGLASAQEQSTSVQSEIQPLLQDEGKREDVLKKIVTASSVLSSAPERGM